ncbi:hypothetical protein J421_4202 [Gemmatirosa kalamazoonensis]|uniref:Outer membrane protein beta-barrel domain-containing protein n=1 Tax=Gemmatirosa kalamazoonensis TaxID=861299 RepID=W0RL02_9BACT|nr:hypothetical protein [Gemmatirosa kalamazoonensis]AHG91739.1 hypothetical protein J421_4202 [Gemmatirosa kalamazoonensis]
MKHGHVLVALVLLAARAGAQPSTGDRRTTTEIRIDGFAARTAGAQAGVGIALDAGTYTRLAVVAGAGFERRPGGALVGVQRLEGVGRFHLDPYRQTRHGVYAGGGLALRHAPGGPVRALVVALLGVEGPPRHGMAAAVEAGVGGGARVGVALRSARRQRR